MNRPDGCHEPGPHWGPPHEPHHPRMHPPEFPPPPGPPGPPPFSPAHLHPFVERLRGRRGPKVGRGDVRSAILLLLAEEPRNGYQIITEIERRSNGVWRPSPGSVYPALAQLEDEELIRVEGPGDRKLFRLTARGQADAERQQGRPPWQAAADNADDGLAELHGLVGQVGMAARQVAYAGAGEDLSRARRILVNARRQLYQILADGADEADDTGPAAAGGATENSGTMPHHEGAEDEGGPA